MNEYGLKSKVSNECRRLAINHFKELGVQPVYIVVSGSHLYGFPSVDSDIDIRCCHIRDTKTLFHLHKGSDVYQWKDEVDGVEIEFESQEIDKIINLAFKNNSNILEHVFTKNLLGSPPTEYLRLKELCEKSISKVVANPYHGMATFNYKKFIESMNPTYRDKLVKKYLYVMRSYLVGAHALRTGDIVPNIRKHLKGLDSDIVDTIKELIEKKKSGEYQVTAIDHKHCREVVAKLRALFVIAERDSKLDDKPSTFDEFDDLLYNIRLKYI